MKKLHFITLNYTLDYTLHPKFYIFIQINGKLNVGVQIVIRVIIYGTKHAFEKFSGKV